LAAPADGEQTGEHAKPLPLRPRPFVGLIEKFGSLKAPVADDDDAVGGEAVEIIHAPPKSIQ
jgi:hypothetical protein